MARLIKICTAALHGRGNEPTIPLDVIQTHILTRLDGPTLTSMCCASKHLFSICSCDDELWRNICNSTWPSTTDPRVLCAISAHRSFYLDCFPSIHHQLPKKFISSEPPVLISAVDIYYKDQLIYSKVLETETAGDGFSDDPLTIDLLDPTERVRTPLVFQGNGEACISLAKQHLKVSWIVIDPDSKRAVQIASHEAMDSRILWWNNNIVNGHQVMARLRYSTVAAISPGKLFQYSVLVSCRRESVTGELHMNQVRMSIEDLEGKSLSGRKSRVMLQAAMQGRRRRINLRKERENYEIFSNKELYERKMEILTASTSLRINLIIIGVLLIFLQIHYYLKKEAAGINKFACFLGTSFILMAALLHLHWWALNRDALIQ